MFRAFLSAVVWASIVSLSVHSPAADQPKPDKPKPLGVPDYTKITGFIPGVQLPTRQPQTLKKIVTESVQPNGELKTLGLTDAVLADGVLYFGSDGGNLTAFLVDPYLVLWSTELGARIAAKPSVSKDFVFFGSKNGITALNRENGAVAWVQNIDHGADETTPIPVGRHFFASGYDGQAYCFDQQTGRVVWQHDFVKDAPEDPSPEFASKRARFQEIAARPNGSACDGKLFIQCVFDQSRVIALDCETGERRWTFQAKGWISPAPTIAGDRVYVASQDKHLYCLERATGKEIWKYQAPTWLASRPAIHNGKVYLPVHGAKLHEIVIETGKLIRILEPPDEEDRSGAVYSFPLIADQTIYFASGPRGQLFAFNLESGQMSWKLRPLEDSELFSSPSTDGRRLFVTSRQSDPKKGESAIFVIGLEP